jgi:hypothetical protein
MIQNNTFNDAANEPLSTGSRQPVVGPHYDGFDGDRSHQPHHAVPTAPEAEPWFWTITARGTSHHGSDFGKV